MFILPRNLGATAATWEGHGFTSSSNTAGVGCLHYQFGRPVPFAGKLGTTTNVQTQQNFAFAIKNPMTYIGTGSYWSNQDGSTAYLWQDKNVDRYADGKSIFDPSPIGWRVPIQGVWSNFSMETFTVSESGRTYTDATAYYPYAGRRNNSSGSLSEISGAGYYWTSSPSSTTSGSYFVFANGTVNPNNTSVRAFGNPLRSVRE